MWALLLFGISMGLLDCLNPFTISTQVVLQPFVKKPRHTLFYIAGTYLSYLIGGVFVFWGVDKIISKYIEKIMAQYSATIFSLEIVLGMILIIMGFVFLFRRIQKEKRLITDEKVNEKKPSAPKSVKPVFLFLFGAANTIGDLPTAFPYLVFIAKIVEMKVSVRLVIPLLAIYCLIYILPLLVVYVLYILNKKKMEHIIQKVQEKIVGIEKWIAVVLPEIVGIFLCYHGFGNIFP